jgi:hypothetical protein
MFGRLFVAARTVFGFLVLGHGSKPTNYRAKIPVVGTGKFGIIRLAAAVDRGVGFVRFDLPLAFRRS